MHITLLHSHCFAGTTYDLRIGTFDSIIGQFENSSKVSLPVTPKNAGEAEEHTIDMSSYNKTETHFLAIRVIDEAGNKGEPSNVISVTLVVPTKFNNGELIACDGPWTWIYIGLIVATVCNVIGVCVCVSVYCYRQGKFKKTPSQGQEEEKAPPLGFENIMYEKKERIA
jgi:hypothetical protein